MTDILQIVLKLRFEVFDVFILAIGFCAVYLLVVLCNRLRDWRK